MRRIVVAAGVAAAVVAACVAALVAALADVWHSAFPRREMAPAAALQPVRNKQSNLLCCVTNASMSSSVVSLGDMVDRPCGTHRGLASVAVAVDIPPRT
jgi:hypothetical protein